MNFTNAKAFMGKKFTQTKTGKFFGSIIISGGKKDDGSFGQPAYISCLTPSDISGKVVISGFLTAEEYKGAVQMKAIITSICKEDEFKVTNNNDDDLPF